MNQISLAVQLYTVRDRCAQDFAGTCKLVAEIGYQAVEMAGYGNLKSASEAKKALDDTGLRVAGSHTSIEALETNSNQVMDENEALGNRNIVISYMPEPRRKDAAGWKNVAASMSAIAARCNQRGFDLAYHNHAFEFDPFDGQTGYDILWANAAPTVKAELDVYWVRHGGSDPATVMKQLGPRLHMLHLKDMAADRKFAAVGSGTIDFVSVIAEGNKAGVKWGIVEQDDCYGQDPLDNIRMSFENVKKLGLACLTPFKDFSPWINTDDHR